ncbi:MAG: hypothetical protein KF887_18750 [Paracoccaceae bacterium]|nr:MAG: hypothetical protein KF887_18750 [Paracoccaceae bacterium]
MIVNQDHPGAFWLTLGMARAAGVNLPGAVVEGWLSRTELIGMVNRCDRCGHDAECTVWLARSQPWPRHLPEICPNAGEIEALVQPR